MPRLIRGIPESGSNTVASELRYLVRHSALENLIRQVAPVLTAEGTLHRDRRCGQRLHGSREVLSASLATDYPCTLAGWALEHGNDNRRGESPSSFSPVRLALRSGLIENLI